MVNIPPTIPAAKKPHPFYFITVVIVLVLGVGAYFVFFGETNLFLSFTFQAAPPLTSLDSKIASLPEFSFSVFDSDLYKSFKIYGNLPIVADSLGRVNPFVSY